MYILDIFFSEDEVPVVFVHSTWVTLNLLVDVAVCVYQLTTKVNCVEKAYATRATERCRGLPIAAWAGASRSQERVYMEQPFYWYWSCCWGMYREIPLTNRRDSLSEGSTFQHEENYFFHSSYFLIVEKLKRARALLKMCLLSPKTAPVKFSSSLEILYFFKNLCVFT